MNEKISSNESSGLRVVMEPSRARTTADNSFGKVIGDGLNRTAGVALDIAGQYVPGVATLSAAISSVGASKSLVTGGNVGTSISAYSSPTSTLVNGGGSAVVAGSGSTVGAVSGTTGVVSGNSSIAQMQSMMELQASFNAQYLMLQQQMQNESRQYSCISNVMKTKHDTAKNSISNVR
ncbi:MAG: hypothetical protein JW841_05895 [Deltaproteobacteria bacterium]|nr:hypothetical protein [Deltaproteobacteria bacterium]